MVVIRLLQLTHLFGQVRLVTHRGRHATEQRRYFRSGQRVTVDVVDKQQHVAAFVTELLGQRQAGQRHPQAVARRFVHLTKHQRDLVENAGLFHLVVEVVAFTSSLADTGKHRKARVLGGDVTNQLEHGDRLTNTGATKQPDLTAFGERDRSGR